MVVPSWSRKSKRCYDIINKKNLKIKNPLIIKAVDKWISGKEIDLSTLFFIIHST